MTPQFHEAIGALLAVVALLVVAYVAVIVRDATATGALIGVLSASVSFFLRGKVQAPDPAPTPPALVLTSGGPRPLVPPRDPPAA